MNELYQSDIPFSYENTCGTFMDAISKHISWGVMGWQDDKHGLWSCIKLLLCSRSLVSVYNRETIVFNARRQTCARNMKIIATA